MCGTSPYIKFRDSENYKDESGDEITKSTLTKQLRELENDGWIKRQIYQEIPPKVEYTLTELAESFVPILEQMKEWSETHLCKSVLPNKNE